MVTLPVIASGWSRAILPFISFISAFLGCDESRPMSDVPPLPTQQPIVCLELGVTALSELTNCCVHHDVASEVSGGLNSH
jgi:hypothetical protein